MGRRVTCINKGPNHESKYTAIEFLGWTDDDTGKSYKSTRLEMCDFVDGKGYAYVEDKATSVKAKLITATTPRHTRYVKTVIDETKADNLLALPECSV